MKKQSGFAVIEIVLVAAVLAIIGFTAYTYYNHDKVVSTTSDSTAASVEVPTAPQINSAADLTTAENAVDQTDVTASDTDSARLDSELANF